MTIHQDKNRISITGVPEENYNQSFGIRYHWKYGRCKVLWKRIVNGKLMIAIKPVHYNNQPLPEYRRNGNFELVKAKDLSLTSNRKE